ncbi:MerR family transcriptional regulator [Serinibacter arcticus]|uniref:MerR family transcriptional regulator n=2 Tax=Serinibacter arcticus TaxID=1655435 RepID=A0A2U1ZZ82_9MICO|nr:MerR family transcriptional regulator [Serinibacter arcticus]
MNIGAVLAVLKREFPAVSHSKIRFLEEQGLVTPQRTPAGYRVFCEADVERLRYALAAQRDSFLPLRVIRDRLAALDAGLEDDAPLPPQPASAGGGRMQLAELAALSGSTPEQVLELDRAGLIATDGGGRYPASCLAVVQLAGELTVHGLDTRHLRLMRSAADRQVDVVAQLTSPLRGRPNTPQDARGRERAVYAAGELSTLLSRLHGALVTSGVERLF